MMRYLTELFLSLPDAHHLRGVSDVDRGRSPGQVIRLPVHILETFTIKHHDILDSGRLDIVKIFISISKGRYKANIYKCYCFKGKSLLRLLSIIVLFVRRFV